MRPCRVVCGPHHTTPLLSLIHLPLTHKPVLAKRALHASNAQGSQISDQVCLGVLHLTAPSDVVPLLSLQSGLPPEPVSDVLLPQINSCGCLIFWCHLQPCPRNPLVWSMAITPMGAGE